MRNFKQIMPAALLISLLLLGGCNSSRDNDIPVFSQSPDNQQIPILMYHKVNPYPLSGGFGLRVPPEQFAWQMRYLRERSFQTISFSDLIQHWEKSAPLPPRPVIITFDDGYRDNFNFAYPVLKANGFKGTIFLVTELVGKTNEWDTKVNLQPENSLLTWKQIKLMENDGIEFGIHTATHQNLTAVPAEQAAREISKSKQDMETALGHPVLVFAYPYGRYNETTEKEVAIAGFKAAVTTVVGKNQLQPEDHFALKRLRVTGYITRDEFVNMIEN